MNSAILTIDDISSKNTPAIVDYLCAKRINAVMFAEGQCVEKYYNEAIYALQKGMVVGNHSFHHPSFSSISLEEGIKEIEECEKLLDKLYADAGVERKYRPFRFPYGDKGGVNKDELQKYLREQGFHKLIDTQITYSWWRDNNLDRDIDTFWTFDFGEYNIYLNTEFTMANVFEKMNDENPRQGASLFGKDNRHIILIHAHDETEELVPEYYKHLIEYSLCKGLVFEEPQFC